MPTDPKPPATIDPASWLAKHFLQIAGVSGPAAADATRVRRAAPPTLPQNVMRALTPFDQAANRDRFTPAQHLASGTRELIAGQGTFAPDTKLGLAASFFPVTAAAQAGARARGAVNRSEYGRAALEAVTGSPLGEIAAAGILPIAMRGAKGIKAAATGNAEISALAEKYLAEQGIQGRALPAVSQVDPHRGRVMASAYERLADAPNDPAVRAAYEQMGREVDAQYKAVTDAGYRFEFGQHDPYQNSAEMMADVRDNRRLKVFKTGEGQEHPLLTNEQNDRFRAVHDFFGHAQSGHQFGPKGEEGAFRDHSRMFSPEAARAMATETRGQNSWVNFGPNRDLPPAERPFAQQKAALWPEHLMGDYDEMPHFAEVAPHEYHGALEQFAQADPRGALFHTPRTPEAIAASGARPFLSADGRAGFLVTPGGELQGVFNHGEKGLGARGVAEAVQHHGATKLDALGDGLADYYQRFGFRETGRAPFDPTQARPGWDASRLGAPDFISMQRDVAAPAPAAAARSAFPPQVDLPRFIAPRMPQSRIDDIEAEALRTYRGPEHEQWLRQGRFGEWYDTRPTEQMAVDALGDQEGPQSFERLMQMMAAVTARSDPGNNLRRATYYRGLERAGLLDLDGLGSAAYKEVPQGMGHIANNAHHAGLARLLAEGQTNSILNPKPAGFDANLMRNWLPFTNDTRMATGAAMANPRLLDLGAIVKKVSKDGGVTFSPHPAAYAPMERAFQQAAREWQARGLINVPDGLAPTAHAQAQIWDGLSSVLPGASPSQGLFSDVFNAKVADNARRWGVSPVRANQLVWEGHPLDLPLGTQIAPKGLFGAF